MYVAAFVRVNKDVYVIEKKEKLKGNR